MTLEPIGTAKLLADAAKYGLTMSSDAMSSSGSRFSRIFKAFAPEHSVSWFEGRRLRVRQIKAHEEVFDKMCEGVVTSYTKRAQRIASSSKRMQSPLSQLSLDEMAGDLRMLNTLRLAVSACPQSLATSNEVADTIAPPYEGASHLTDVSWLDTFEMFARRHNEDWRTQLFARALIEDDKDPGCISLKSLWELGMMDAGHFGSLAAFCDCALYIDGAPMVLLEPEEQVKYVIVTEDGLRTLNLASLVSMLIETGLVHKSPAQFETTGPVRLDHFSGPSSLEPFPPKSDGIKRSAVQIEGFVVSDYALVICRLYQPKSNEASDANFSIFQKLLNEMAEDDPLEFGEVRFSYPKSREISGVIQLERFGEETVMDTADNRERNSAGRQKYGLLRVVMERDFDSYGSAEREAFLVDLENLLALDRAEMRNIVFERGCVHAKIQVPESDLEALVALYQQAVENEDNETVNRFRRFLEKHHVKNVTGEFEVPLQIRITRPTIDAEYGSQEIVLIHGFNGDEQTFGDLPRYLSELFSCRATPYVYPTNWRKHSPSIYYLAKSFDRWFRNTVRSKRVALIAHSMGGVLVRKFLTIQAYHPRPLNAYVKQATFIASPFDGSPLGSFASQLGIGGDQLAELDPSSAFIAELKEAWIAWSTSHVPEYCQIGSLYGTADKVVSPANAMGTTAGAEAIDGEDHRSIVKPYASGEPTLTAEHVRG